MSKKFLVPIDMGQLEILNAVLQNLPTASAPANPVAGQMYFNTTTHKFMYYDGTNWVALGASESISPYDSNPAMNGTAAPGSSANFARGDHVHPTDTSRAASSHTHGNITNGGDITATAPTIASGDQIIINDHSASKVTNGPTFDGSTTSKALSQKGTWESFAPTSHASSATTYGTGTSSNYGHVKLSDSTSSTSSTSGGTAATPAAVKAAYDLANGKQDPLTIDTSISSSSTNSNVPSSKAVYDYVGTAVGAVDAMRFKGTIGTGGDVSSLPTSGVKVGDTYRVITAGTYAGQTCEVGDLIIATATTPTWTVAQTNIDGAITAAGTGLSKSGSTLNHSNSVTAKTTQALYPIKFDAQGHITGAGTAIGNATTSTAGLMSASDKDSLDELTSYTHVTGGTVSFTPTAGNLTKTVSGIVSSYFAYDATTGEEVIIDATKSGSNTIFSVASAYPNTIMINTLSSLD